MRSPVAAPPKYWELLRSRPERPENRVLTVYLNVDQSQQANLNRGFENEVKDMLTSVRRTIFNDRDLKRFEAAAQAMQELAASYHVGARGLIAVFDTSDGFFWSKEVTFPVTNSVHWSRGIYLLPLAVALEESARLGVVLVDRANVRLASVFLGEFEEHLRRSFDHQNVHHTKTVGMNSLASAARAQHRADEQVRLNFRQMTRDIDLTFAEEGSGPIVLAGTAKTTADLHSRLPKRLAARVIGHIDIPISATADRIVKASQALLEKRKTDSEETAVNDLVTAAAKARRAVIGLEDTLRATNHHRIWRLVYADGFQASGYECSRCAALFAVGHMRCPFCRSTVRRIDDIVVRVVDQAIRKDARIEIVRSKRAQSSLMNAGAIGAFLRTRTGALRAS